VAKLVELGHRRIMHISGPWGLLGAERRVDGYRSALLEAGIEPDPDLLIDSNFTAIDGKKVMLEWLDAHASRSIPDAIFCANDSAATGALEALASRGIRVPTDVSLCGFDDTIAARTTVPQLATVLQPLRAMGGRAVEILMQRIEAIHGGGPDFTHSPVVFDTSVILRDSVTRMIASRLTSASALNSR
jgi:LacI family transcriptional regulator